MAVEVILAKAIPSCWVTKLKGRSLQGYALLNASGAKTHNQTCLLHKSQTHDDINISTRVKARNALHHCFETLNVSEASVHASIV